MYNTYYCHDKTKTIKKERTKMSAINLAYEFLPSSDERITEFDELLSE